MHSTLKKKNPTRAQAKALFDTDAKIISGTILDADVNQNPVVPSFNFRLCRNGIDINSANAEESRRKLRKVLREQTRRVVFPRNREETDCRVALSVLIALSQNVRKILTIFYYCNIAIG